VREHERWWSRVDPSLFLANNNRESYAVVAGMLTEGSVLEVGCGVGSLYKHINDRDYTGIDITRNFIEYLRKRHPEATFKEAGILAIPYGDKEFDESACMSVFEHMHPEDVEKGITELIRVTKSLMLIELCIPPWSAPASISNSGGAYNNRYNESEFLGYIESNPRFKSVEKVKVPPHHVVYKVNLRTTK